MELLDLLLIVPSLCCIATEHVLGTLDQAPLPVLDLIGVNIELLSQLGKGMLSFHRCQSDLRFESR